MNILVKRSSKFIRTIVLILFLMNTFLGCNDNPDTSKNPNGKKELLIGVLLPLTGPSAIHGKDCLEGIEMALEAINSKGGLNGVPVKLKIEDTGSKPSSVANGMVKLIDIDHVKVIIGPISSAETNAGASIATINRVILFSPTCASKGIHLKSNYTFSIGLMTEPQGQRMADYCYTSLGINSMGMLIMSDETGTAYAKAFQLAYEKLGGRITSQLSYFKTDVDFRTALSQLKRDKITSLYVTCIPTTMGLIARQALEIDFKPKLFANAGVEGEDLFNKAGTAANGIIFTGLAPNKKFLDDFYKRTNRQPGISGPQGFDSFNLVINAIKIKGENPNELIKYFMAMQAYEGVGGSICFDKNGDVMRKSHLKIVRDGRFEKLQN